MRAVAMCRSVSRRAAPIGRQQPVEAQLAMDGSAGLVEAGHDPMLLAGLLDDDRRTFLRLLPPGLDRRTDELLLRNQGGLPLAPDSDLDGLSELHELLQLGIGLGDADVAGDALAGLPSLAHGFDELDGLPEASRLGFGTEEHDAIPDSAFSESLPRLPGFRKIIVVEALHFPLERDRAGIPLRATLRKAETALKSSQTVEVRISNIAIINAVLYFLENGCKRRALPKRFGKWYSVYARFRRRSRSGVLERLFAALRDLHAPGGDANCFGLDSASAEVHPDGAGARKTNGPAKHRQVARRMEHEDPHGFRK